ncbi:MAG: transglutaminase domain-containing protein, partial [Deltaproteobacteria bacterium]|nr:transglutaminase domain-containing protein [Deltaproteobacteria bacterium]
RFFADWVLISGRKDIDWWLQLFGAAVAAAALLMLVRVRRTVHLLWATAAAALLLGALFWWVDVKKPRAVVEPISFAGSGRGDDGGGGGGEGRDGGGEGEGGEGKGDGQGGGGAPQPPPRPPVPVAVAVFHDDYTPENGVLYFRQQALSFFDGTKLVADPSGRFDDDVLTELPNEAPLLAAPAQEERAHVLVSTSMFLIDEHPTPPALTHGVELSPLRNPDTARFVAAYGVRSLVPSAPITRHVGRRSVPRDWGDERRAYYLRTHSDDPRYAALAAEVARELPSHHAADPLRRALAVKRYLEREGYYTLKVKHRSSQDPVAPFLFGDMRGYCVHFAHSAAHLLRSLGVASRVALGYAVDARTRSNSSAVVITGDRAHAWPEIHLEGVGWVTFDIYPERSDEPPPSTVSQSLESLLGELARDQVRRGLPPERVIPWRLLGLGALGALACLALLGYLVGLARALRAWLGADEAQGRLSYALALDRLGGAGFARRFGETREAYAARLAPLAPSLPALTAAHCAWALGDPARRAARGREARALSAQVRAELAARRRLRWLLGVLNPVAWLWAR